MMVTPMMEGLCCRAYHGAAVLHVPFLGSHGALPANYTRSPEHSCERKLVQWRWPTGSLTEIPLRWPDLATRIA